MQSQEVKIKSHVKVVLKSDAEVLDEVVVIAAGIKRSEKSLGYAVSQVSADDVIVAGEPDMLKALQGKVAGVDIRSSQGGPGSATKINIRGASSFFGDNEPLIIVDGVPLSNQQITTSTYMALIPIIQPFFMKLFTTKAQRQIRMDNLRTVSKKEKLIFPVVVTLIVGILLPDALPLLGMLMLGNFMKESLCVERLVKTASNELMNIVTIFLGLIVGTKAVGSTFLSAQTLGIIAMGLLAFIFGTIGGVLTAQVINLFSKKKINPLIGSAGVSAVPMAARVSQKVGQEECPDNYLLMHAMGPNVAGVIGSAVAAGVFLALFA